MQHIPNRAEKILPTYFASVIFQVKLYMTKMAKIVVGAGLIE